MSAKLKIRYGLKRKKKESASYLLENRLKQQQRLYKLPQLNMSHRLIQSYVILVSLDLESAESALMKPASMGKIHV